MRLVFIDLFWFTNKLWCLEINNKKNVMILIAGHSGSAGSLVEHSTGRVANEGLQVRDLLQYNL